MWFLQGNDPKLFLRFPLFSEIALTLLLLTHVNPRKIIIIQESFIKGILEINKNSGAIMDIKQIHYP